MKLSPYFCSAVLSGVRKHALSIPSICELIGVRAADLRLVLQEKASLKVRQIQLIERATGLTAGQLAVKSDPLASASLGELMDQWALAVPITGRSVKRTRKPAKAGRA